MANQASNAASQTPAAGKPFLFPHTEIPKEISSFVTERMGTGAGAHPPRQDGIYRGRVLLNSDKYLVQSVGRSNNSAIVHKKEGMELMGSNLQWRDQNKRLGSVDVQVYYSGDKSKTYEYNREREDQKRMLARAEVFSKTIKDEKKREDFMFHLKGLLASQQKERDDKSKSAPAPDRSQDRSKSEPKRSAPAQER